MTLPAVSDAALAYALALQAGVVLPAVIVAWADRVIAAHPAPPLAVLDVSLSGGDVNGMLRALNELSAPRLDRSGFRLLCGLLREWLMVHPAQVRPVTTLLSGAASEGALPLEVEAEARGFDVELDLAFEGYGSEQAVQHGLLGFLSSRA